MPYLQQFIHIILHLDQYLYGLTVEYGPLIYGILFLIVFCETGLVVTPFLPGDSLLFAAGTLAAVGQLHIHLLVLLLIIAAILGDALNYALGHYFGPKVFKNHDAKFFNPKYLDRTNAFYEKYGGKTIIIARFVPIIRTFAPFVAGISHMTYARFLSYNIIGAILWVSSICYAAYWFGNVPFIAHNFSLVIVAIIGISLLPALFEILRYKFSAKPLEK